MHRPDAVLLVSGVPISLHRECADSSGVWDCIAEGQTNKDGRIGDLLPPSDTVLPGLYRCMQEMYCMQTPAQGWHYLMVTQAALDTSFGLCHAG